MSNRAIAQTASRPAVRLSRHELFAALCIGGFISGISARVGASIAGSDLIAALQSGFQVSWIAWLALALGLRLALKSPPEVATRRDFLVGAVSAILIVWPVAPLSWIGITFFAVYLIAERKNAVQLRASAMIFLALTVTMLWAKFVPYFASNFFETIDTAVVSAIMGARSSGNVLYFADGINTGIVEWPCTSFANASFALLLWVAVTRTARPEYRRHEWLSLLGVFGAVFAINSVRLALMTRSREVFERVHGPAGFALFNAALLLAALAISLYGVRRELAR